MTGERPTNYVDLNPDYCHYGAKIFLPLLMQLETELQGVIRDDDIEYVHRCRVASRRIRSAFSLFSSCFPTGKRKRWEKQVRMLTRSLGEARDLDVQIGYVRSILKELHKGENNVQALFSSTEPEPAFPTVISSEPVTLVKKSGIIPLFRSRISHWMGNHRILIGNTGTSGQITALSPVQQNYSVLTTLPDDPAIIGIECLLLRLLQRRRVMQSDVSSAATQFLSGGTITELSRYLHDLKIRSLLRGEGTHQAPTYEHSFMQIMRRITDLFWFEPALEDPASKENHHAMRIMAKRLRYTMEAYTGLYEDSFKDNIKKIKKIQEYLGDIHDCDVWIDYLPLFLAEEEERTLSYFGNHQFSELIQPGIMSMMQDRKEQRSKLFEEFCGYWDQVKDENFWDSLVEQITIPVRSPSDQVTAKTKPGPLTIALISDVHANLPALEAVLADAKSRGAAVILNAGDLIGYGPFPDDVVSLIRSRHILSVIGNYDLSVLRKKWKTGKPRSAEKQVAMRWAYHQLSKDNREWLDSLPRVLRLPVRGQTLLVTHGSPESVHEYLDDGTPEVRLREIASEIHARIVVTGHSHRHSIREVNGVWFVNTGSVGRSEDGDPRACYALITVDPFSFTHIRVPYDISRTIAELRHHHLPDSFARIVQEGKSLDMVREPEPPS